MALIGKLAGKALSKTAVKAAPKVVLSLSEELAQEAAEAAPAKVPLVARKKASKALKAEEKAPEPSSPVETPAASEAVAEEDVVLSLSEQMAKRESLAAQTEEALPSPAAAETPLSGAGSPYNFPNKAFSDEQYAAAEKELEDSFLMPSMYTKLKGNKEKFANELQKKAKKLFGGEEVEMPYEIESKALSVDEAIAEVEASKAQKAQKAVEEGDVPARNIDKTQNIYSGKLGTSYGAESNEILEQIRQLREQNYKTLTGMRQAQKYDDPVLNVALGEFRHKYGYEFDPVIRRDSKRIFKLMDEEQRRYNNIKEKYANTPDITVYHGGKPEKIESVVTEGFRRPSLSKRTAQQELKTGATSFTRDVGLDFSPAAGFGEVPKNIVQKKIPYAEYVFTRVNMTPDQYKNKELDATARTITGSPTGIRGLQLPRTSGFGETETAYIESDKIVARRNVDELSEKKKTYDAFNKRKLELQDKLTDEAAKFDSSALVPRKDAVRGYDLIKKYLENAGKLGNISNVRSGIGESYESAMTSLFYRQDYLIALRDSLQQYDIKEKAYNMSRLVNISKRGLKAGTDTKVGSDILGLSQKFNRGGLVSRK